MDKYVVVKFDNSSAEPPIRALIRDSNVWWLAEDVYKNLFVAPEHDDWEFTHVLEVVLPWGPGTMNFFDEVGFNEVIDRSIVAKERYMVRYYNRAIASVGGKELTSLVNSDSNATKREVPIQTPTAAAPQERKSMRNSRQNDSVVKRKSKTGAYSE